MHSHTSVFPSLGPKRKMLEQRKEDGVAVTLRSWPDSLYNKGIKASGLPIFFKTLNVHATPLP